MEKQEAIELINNQINSIIDLKVQAAFSSEFERWKRDTEVVLKSIFGVNATQVEDFRKINYKKFILGETTYDQSYIWGLNTACEILKSMIKEINLFDNKEISYLKTNKSIDIVVNICNKFNQVVHQIKQRHADRETIKINDEYDVQDLLHALLRLHFDDVRSEEWTPSYAGCASRMDFLLKNEKIVIEVKKTRKGLGAKEVGEQLIIDIDRYQAHPNCDTLICFVYDPCNIINNPRGLINDLNRNTEKIKVITIINPI